jgi:hypothetical protein
VVGVAEEFDATQVLERILTEYGPLDRNDIAERLHDTGVADPDAVANAVIDEMHYPTRQLVDDRWIWLSAVLAGRVFTHRLGRDEAAHDLLTVTPNLGPITALCEYEEYRRLTDGLDPEIRVADEIAAAQDGADADEFDSSIGISSTAAPRWPSPRLGPGRRQQKSPPTYHRRCPYATRPTRSEAGCRWRGGRSPGPRATAGHRYVRKGRRSNSQESYGW